ncbi:beta-L-arabinofuranosidase domain-containing protein [Populibacterium corticicola]|uniref:Beta-L-arabinofuranosidase domain-containing protein n=1 Tax=Populibacterium corticicola TaxID=1812826 RepID=A0ABW5XBT2_9MICO
MRPLSPGSIRLTTGPFAQAQELGAHYILSLDPDRLLAPYRREAGLPSPTNSYGNWENSGLDGHTLGHVLSTAAHLHAATGSQDGSRLVANLVQGIKEAQDHLGTGYVGGIPQGSQLWERVASGAVEPDSFGLNGAWVPWYNLHKLFAGLIDAHQLTASTEALEVVTKLADWWLTIARQMSDDTHEAMLRTEFGAMNAAFADLFELTGTEGYLWLAYRFTDQSLFGPLSSGEHVLPGKHANTQIAKAYGYARVAAVAEDSGYWTAAANLWKQVTTRHTYIFGGNSVREHFTESLSAGFDSEQGPETCNTYNLLRLTHELLAAPESILSSCEVTRDDLLDFYERALFNHVLSSQHPETGGLVYFTPVRPDQYRVYSQAQQCFWCCVGTGMENHTRYPELIGANDNDTLFVNFGIAATIDWAERGLSVEVLDTVTSASELAVRLVAAPSEPVSIAVRLPWWSRRNNRTSWSVHTRVFEPGEVLRFPLAKRVTAHIIADDPASGVQWVAFQRGPLALAAATSASELTGLVADDSRMGHVAQGPIRPLAGVPVVVADGPLLPDVSAGGLLANLLPMGAQPLGVLDEAKVVFEDDVDEARADPTLHAALDALAPRPGEPTVALKIVSASNEHTSVALAPLYQVHDTRYTMYFPVTSVPEPSPVKTDESEEGHQPDPRKFEAAAEVRTALARLDARNEQLDTGLLDFVAAGEQQPESDHHFSGLDSLAQVEDGHRWRDATGWFSYRLRATAHDEGAELTDDTEHATGAHVLDDGDGDQPAALTLTIVASQQLSPSRAAILIDGVPVGDIELSARTLASEPPQDFRFPIKQASTTKPGTHLVVTIRAEVAESSEIGALTPRIHHVRLRA